jgi:hypothetical protein
MAQSTPVTTTPTTTTPAIKIYPNPVFENATLLFDVNDEKIEIQIYSMQGQLVENLQFKNLPQGRQQIQLQLGHLPRGNYQLTVMQKQNRQTTRFVVI